MKAAFCPKCGYGGEDAAFYEVNLAWVYARFRPIVDEDTDDVEEDYTGESEVDWNSQDVPFRFGVDVPRYRCPDCGGMFDHFDIRNADEDEEEEDDWDDDYDDESRNREEDEHC